MRRYPRFNLKDFKHHAFLLISCKISQENKHYNRHYCLPLYSPHPKKMHKRNSNSVKNPLATSRRKIGCVQLFLGLLAEQAQHRGQYPASAPRDFPTSPEWPCLGTYLSGYVSPRRACSRPLPHWSHLRNEESG